MSCGRWAGVHHGKTPLWLPAPTRIVSIPLQTEQSTPTRIASDSPQRELEIVAIETPDCFLVIHAMPTSLRKGPLLG